MRICRVRNFHAFFFHYTNYLEKLDRTIVAGFRTLSIGIGRRRKEKGAKGICRVRNLFCFYETKGG